MANLSLNIKYRPLRIGFCVHKDKIEDLQIAAELNTLLCGGMYNPIIAIGGDEAISESIVKLFNVDLLYPVSDGPEIKAFIEKHEHLKSFDFRDKFIWSTDQGWADGNGQVRLRILDVIKGLEAYAADDNKVLNVKWGDSDPLATLFSLEFGKFPSGQHPYNLPETFKRAFFDKPLNISSTKELDSGLMLNPAPIHISTLDTHLWDSGYGWNTSGIYIGDHENFNDLVNFWNLKATGLDILFVPFKYAEMYRQVVKIHVERIKKFDDKLKFPNGVGCWYAENVSEEIVNVIIQELNADPKILNHHCRLSSASWNGLNIRPAKPYISDKTIIANVDTKYGSPRLSFQLPELHPANNGDGYRHPQHFCVSIHPITEFEYEGYTLKNLPYFTDMNEWYSRRIKFHPYDVRIEPDGFSVIIDTNDSVETMSPVKNELLLKELFKRAGITAEDSQAGLLARKLIEQMDGLEGCRVFKVPGVRKLIASMTSRDVTTQGNATNVIYDIDETTKVPSFKAHEDLHIQSLNRPKLTPTEVFSFMLTMKMFRAGIELSCTHCKLKSWLPINGLNHEVTCEYCGGEVELITQLKDRGDWKFRKSGLIGSDNNQEGAIPVTLTLLQFLRMSHIDEFVYSPALKLDSATDGVDCETDFAILGRSHNVVGRDSVAIAIGEVKSNSDEISDQDITNLSKVKEVLDKSGVKTYLVFAKTAQFTADEIKRFKDLVTAGIVPILLTNTELEPYEVYDHYRKNNITIPEPYGSSFEDMARNTLSLYLS